jgi:hypothetical protein
MSHIMAIINPSSIVKRATNTGNLVHLQPSDWKMDIVVNTYEQASASALKKVLIPGTVTGHSTSAY